MDLSADGFAWRSWRFWLLPVQCLVEKETTQRLTA
jgi:hypothetical protein